MYYPAIMRTTTIDPLAEKYYSISPYAWCGNNPVRFIDPNGKWFWEAKNVRDARHEAKNSGGEFTKWTGQDGRKWASVNYAKGENSKIGGADIKVFKPEGRSWGEAIAAGDKSLEGRSDPGNMGSLTKQDAKDLAKGVQKVGDGISKVGYGLTMTGADVKDGALLYFVGETISTVGTGIEIVVQISEGDTEGALTNMGFLGTGFVAGKVFKGKTEKTKESFGIGLKVVEEQIKKEKK